MSVITCVCVCVCVHCLDLRVYHSTRPQCTMSDHILSVIFSLTLSNAGGGDQELGKYFCNDLITSLSKCRSLFNFSQLEFSALKVHYERKRASFDPDLCPRPNLTSQPGVGKPVYYISRREPVESETINEDVHAVSRSFPMRRGITQRSAIYQRKAPDIKNPSRHLLEAARFAL